MHENHTWYIRGLRGSKGRLHGAYEHTGGAFLREMPPPRSFEFAGFLPDFSCGKKV